MRKAVTLRVPTSEAPGKPRPGSPARRFSTSSGGQSVSSCRNADDVQAGLLGITRSQGPSV